MAEGKVEERTISVVSGVAVYGEGHKAVGLYETPPTDKSLGIGSLHMDPVLLPGR